jgi:acyl dehydratase
VTVFETNATIDDAEIERVRGMIGEELRLPPSFNKRATADVIRHFAQGCGDDNPLWFDPAYARAHGHDGVLAPPTYFYSVFPPGIGPGFDGLQGFHAGSRWEFARPVRENEEVVVSARLTDVEDVMGRRSGRTIIQHGLAEYRTPTGELLATNALDKEILDYRRRGSEPRYFENTAVGEALGERIKGPLILDDIIAFAIAIGNVAPGELALKTRAAYASATDQAPNHRPLGWLLERVNPGAGHMDPTVARAVGMPAVYDNGWLRMCWMGQYVTDWMGDASELKVLDVKLRLPNLVGDVLRLSGEITGKRDEDGQGLVDMDIRALRQDGEVSCRGTATVALPHQP